MHAELALHSTAAQATAHGLGMLCLQCPGLHLGSGHQHLPARTPALVLPLACLSLPMGHLPAQQSQPEGCLCPLQTPQCSRVVGHPRRGIPGSQKSMCPKEAMGDLWVGPCLCPSHQVYIYFYLGPSRQPSRVSLTWGHQAGQGKGNDTALGETLQVGGDREKGVYAK